MKKIPLHKKLLLGAVTGGLGYSSYKLFKHTDAGSRKMEMINPVTPLLLVADDERRNAAIVGGVAGAGLYAGRHDIKNKINNLYNKTISKENRPNLVNSAENDDYVRTGAVTGGILGAVGRKGFAVAPVLGGAAVGAGMGYLAKKNSNDNYNSPIKDHIKAIAKTTIPLGAAGGAAAVHIGSKAINKAMKEKPHLVYQLPAHVLENVKQLKGAKGALIGAGVGAAGAALSSPVFGSIYGGAVHLKRAITEKNNIKSSEAQESLRRVNEIIAGLTVKQATPIFKKIVAKKKALGASTSQAQKAALKILHRIDR